LRVGIVHQRIGLEKTGFSSVTTGSSYIEVNADIPLMDTGFIAGLHAGHQDIRAFFNGINPDFNDYRISLSRSFNGGWTGAVQVTKNSNTAFFNGTVSSCNAYDTRDVGRRRYVVSLTRSF
jgi:hypothetical protein